MKRNRSSIDFSAALLLAVVLSSCDRFGDESLSGNGRLDLSFVKGGELFTKAYAALPDTSDFLLTITDAAGKVLYDGKYGDCPESVDVSPGTYTVKVISSTFARPSFDSPQFGDEQCIRVPGDGVGKVRLSCSQMNAGVRLDVSSAFLTLCPDAVLFLRSAEGKLMYSYSEKRTAYFNPGAVSLAMSSGGNDEVLMVRELKARDMLTIGVSVPVSDGKGISGMSVSVDTSRVWLNEECVIGTGDSGTEISDALSVAEARNAAGKENVWVCGYVVGGDLTSASASFLQPFRSRTNLLLGPRSSTVDRSVCLSVQLPDGELRERLNLVDNPEMLGKRICIRGDVVSSYYGLPGMKNMEEYQML